MREPYQKIADWLNELVSGGVAAKRPSGKPWNIRAVQKIVLREDQLRAKGLPSPGQAGRETAQATAAAIEAENPESRTTFQDAAHEDPADTNSQHASGVAA
jgi:hypothetical protein